MKKIVLIAIADIFFCLSLYAQEVNKVFYYYQGEKIYLQPRTDKVFLKFTHNVKKEQVQALINENASVRLTSGRSLDDDFYNSVVLEVKENSRVSSVIESYKTRDEIVSVTPILQYNDALQGFTDEFAVKLKGTTSYEQLQELAGKNHCKVGRENEFVKNQFMVHVSKTSNLDALQMSNLFYETGLFVFSEPNFIVLNAFQTNDTYFNQQWSLKNIGQNGGTSGIDIKIEQAWSITQGSPNIKIAVIDQGVDLTHPDFLKANLLPGFDASGNNSGGAPVWSEDKHGTVCAGIIGAMKDSGIGISGVSSNCKIIPIHASNNGGGLPNDWAANSIQWAWQNGADVISNSWGGGSNSAAIDNAINAAVTQGRSGKGCVVVFASGNNYANSVSYPASLPNVIAVGAIKRNGYKAGFSNYGSTLDVVAPGVDIFTTDIHGNAGYNYTVFDQNDPAYSDCDNKDYTKKFDGTSAACPHVAGVAALILSVRPDLTQAQVRHTIESTCTKIKPTLYTYSNNTAHPNGTWNSEVGHGLVNAYAAVNSVAPRINGPTSICGNAQPVTFTASNRQPGFTWATSSNLAVTGGNTASNSITVQLTSYSSGWVAVMMGSMELCRRNFSFSSEAPVVSHIENSYGMGSFYTYDRPIYSVVYATNDPGGVTYDWFVSGGCYDILYQGTNYPAIMMCDPGWQTIYVYVSNACGSDAGSTSVLIIDNSFSSVYPNPASNILNIEIDAAALARAKSSAPAITSGKQLKIDPDYDIRLYDNRGTLLRRQKTKGGKVEFSVADLPNGIYYLHIHDGVSGKPEMRQIVVEH